MEFTHADGQSTNAIIALLQTQNLPTEDLPTTLSGFYTAIDEGMLVGLIGLEQYGNYGLLRSMVVHPDYRNRKIAAQLVRLVEEHAAASGNKAIYLLTETAEQYFTKKGYVKISRDEVPAELRVSSEFSHVCPASAAVMVKHLPA